MFPFHFARVTALKLPTLLAGLKQAVHLLIGILIVVSLLWPASAAASPQPQSQADIDSAVLKQFESQSEVTFWVIFRQQADLTPAYSIKDWEERGQFVYRQLRAQAESSQARVRALLKSSAKVHRSYWIVNAIQVTADEVTLRSLAIQPDVGRIIPDRVYHIPPPQPGTSQPGVNGIEWNIDRIHAPDVWSTFGVRGEGIVVANIDSGVQFDHPALVSQYRGNQGNGVFDHNYNWFDPSQICGSPSLNPCDNQGHGTHTMGTMIGDDGSSGGNQIGVAPGARWIAAKGCEALDCSSTALMASGEWILAPTDLNGENPRPDLRPHVVNNSWGGGAGDPFYQGIVNAWVAAGIFPQFANGNFGPFCGSSGSPGDYTESYSAGAFDASDNIAEFSSRGSSFFGDTKPNIAAPGVDVRSSVPGGGYEFNSGTSMASPHVAGTVALLWSASPVLMGDVAATRELLDQTAGDVDDQSCGGTAADNNTWGEGRLDAFTAVDLSPRGPIGALQGTVTDAETGLPIAGATVRALGEFQRTVFTDLSGNYSFPALSVGTYDLQVEVFAYLTQTAVVDIAEDALTVQDFALTPAPAYELSGTLSKSSGAPLRGVKVEILSTPLEPVMTDENGFYRFASVPAGEYNLSASAACYDPLTQHVVVDRNQTLNITLLQHSDEFGYTCENSPSNYVEASDNLGLYGIDNFVTVDLPFPFPFYGQIYETANITVSGFLNFEQPFIQYVELPIPDFQAPHAAIYPFWDDVVVDEGMASIRTEVLGSAPNRQFVVEWRDVAFCCISAERVRFEVILFEDGRILMQYASIDSEAREQGNSATIGIENQTSTIALQYSFDQAVLNDQSAIYYTPPPGGFVQGRVTDAIDGLPLAGAQVTAIEANSVTTTDADGQYQMFLREGTHTLEASLLGYVTEQAIVNITDKQTYIQDFVLRAPRAQVTPEAFEFLLTAGETDSGTMTLSNIGQADLTFTIGEINVNAAMKVQMLPAGTDTHTAFEDYQPIPVAPVAAGGSVLVFMDAYPWGVDSLLQVLNTNGIPYDLAGSWDMGTVDMSQYEVIFLSSDQPVDFYANYSASFSRFDEFVRNGGFLWVGAASGGFNGGDFTGSQLPGGATVGPLFGEILNTVVDASHPTMVGVPDPFYGNAVTHTYFENLPFGTNVIARGQDSGQPTLIEYDLDAGRVLALAQTLEYGYAAGEDAGIILANAVPYAYAFEPFVDIPWLSEDIVAGTIPPGGSQAIQVNVDTSGLEPGVYRARLAIVTNDPDHPRLEIPVTLIVSAYMLGVNAGGDTYTDLAGSFWAADQPYQPGSWGYVNQSTVVSTNREISGTDDDTLYQTQRQNILEYRFDDLAPGVYQVELRFAELSQKAPNKRRFDIMMEGDMVLTFHDIALEVGSFAADSHTFFVVVTDGALNVRFISYRGYGVPIVSALRVVHRPDF